MPSLRRTDLAGSNSTLIAGAPARETEVKDLDQSTVGEHDVGGFQITMKYTKLVRGTHSVRDLDTDRKHQRYGRGAFMNDGVEGLARDILHDDVGFIGGLADFIDGTDIRVLNSRCEPGFPQDRGPHLLDGERPFPQHFEHDRPHQQRVGGKIDNATAARAQLAGDLVVLQDAGLHAVSLPVVTLNLEQTR